MGWDSLRFFINRPNPFYTRTTWAALIILHNTYDFYIFCQNVMVSGVWVSYFLNYLFISQYMLQTGDCA